MRVLLIHADAGPRVGAGHVMRCLALAQAWMDRGGKAVFLLGPEAAPLRRRLEDEGLEIFDAGGTVELARKIGADWVVLDGYCFGISAQRAVKDADFRLMKIDDHAHAAEYVADVVLDPHLRADERRYASRPSSSRLLLGARYVLLRREFRTRMRSARPAVPAVHKLLVSLGGSDPDNQTALVLQALSRVPDPRRETVVVVGPTNSHRTALEAAARGVAGTVRFESDVTRMADLMAWADAAVSAAGGTCWEMAFMGLPAVLVIAAENQRPNVQALAGAGAALYGGTDLEGAIARLLSDGSLRAELSARGQSLLDGKGADRAAAVLEAGLLRFRRATEGDAGLLWEWANDPEARAVSFTTDAIPWETHVAWLGRKLADPACVLKIVTNESDVPVGQVRYDGQGSEAVVSISLAAKFRRRGWGAEIVRRATVEYLGASSAAVVHAYVKPGNEASERVFRDAGFAAGGKGAPGHPEASHWVFSRDQAR